MSDTSNTVGFHGALPKAPSLKDRLRGSAATLKKAALGIAIIAVVAGAADYGRYYWTTGQYLVSTDDAYVKADFTTIAPKVSGYIAEVLVADNQHVTAGQPLARIDDRDFRTALAQANADVAAAHAAIGNLDAQIDLQQSMIDQARSVIASAEAGLAFARQDDSRYQALMRTGYGTIQRAQQASASLREKNAESDQARAGLIAAQKKIDVLKTGRTQAEATLAHNAAVAQQAQLNLGYTVIAAPVDGTVGARSLRVGQYVQAGTQLMAVVPLNAVYVVGNFKETQLTDVHGGQPVTVEVDGFPGRKLHGHVDSVAPASGLEFALLPPDNATGNFTKIVQRIPVKIDLDDDPVAGSLRPGMSATPVIDTHPATR
ncbi:MAG TPA: HlyD family secretion protein [Stellaceae bacterium]|jgi:membrane fusion protein (multidrug efflux system)|nr:HlyD family secretion protein [Stellaceae bacterium]